MRRLLLLIALLCCLTKTGAQEFVNLTVNQVRIDSVLPVYGHEFPLGTAFADSAYTVSIDYPEFIDMTEDDIVRYHAISNEELPAMPAVDQYIGVSRRQGTLYASFVPLVLREGRYQKLVSFRLSLHAQPKAAARTSRLQASDFQPQPQERYASHSVLATGQWVKVSVDETGVYQLTESLVRQAGFSDINKVKIYGYGGSMQPEVLTADYLRATDDLKEVATCTIGGRRLFHAVGPVSWSSNTTTQRTRNPYSDVGCYFLTQNDDGEPLTVDSATFVGSFYPAADDYHSLYEVDDYAWYHGGRNLYESTPIPTDSWRSYELPAYADSGTLTMVMSYDGLGSVSIEVNDSAIGVMAITNELASVEKANVQTKTYELRGLLKERNTIRLRQTAGTATMRLDYLALTMGKPAPAPDLRSSSLKSPKLMYRITNQDHHADTAADMIIIIPTSGKLLAQAERLKKLHEEHDSLSVRIIPADELINEFSSGTPDANAYRRYLKMLYDRAENENDMPRYLLLFGDGTWDNRMLTGYFRQQSPDDYLLCYESENSYSETECYVSDDYFCLLDDGEGSSLIRADKTDVGVGRLTATTEAQAKILVDKIELYMNNQYAGDWQNTLCFMADDGNNNTHMYEAEAAVNSVVAEHPSFNVQKIYWDAYERVPSTQGFRYPDAERLVSEQMQRSALIMDYCGHGAAYCLSHEQVVRIEDFARHTSLRLPLWVTASCDIMPYDTHEDNIGETAMLNAHGGAIAFFGTTRTVYTGDNQNMNCSFLRQVLATDANGRSNTLGDAVRLSKNSLRFLSSESRPINKLHYTLLGDPALRLAKPTMEIVIDSIDGQSVSNVEVRLSAGTAVRVAGHVTGADDFDGTVSLTVKDVESIVVCRLNNPNWETGAGSRVAYKYPDRPTTLYNGQDSIRQGHFSMTFVLPQDISYSEETGRMTAYALSSDRSRKAAGYSEDFSMGSDTDVSDDGTGPSIYCYLNTSAFQNGGDVNTTPYFHAQITDKDGINASGSGLGHDMELVIDGDPTMTYTLNPYFQYAFGDYRSGTLGYTLPTLSEGSHRLTFRAWDVLNNSSVAELQFNVVKALKPNCFSVECTRNPASTSTSFIINHDRTGSQMDVVLEVFDTSGRMLWARSETGLSTDNTYQLDWDLTTSSGSRLQTGVYLYRVLISNDGSKRASQAGKLIILSNH